MRDSNSFSGQKDKLAIKDDKDTGNVSTDISPDKPVAPSNANGDDISPEGLLEVIN